jgi:hypothetical protein
MTRPEMPQPVQTDRRLDYGVQYYRTAAEAEQAAAAVQDQVFAAGPFAGDPCGRMPDFDYDDPTHGRLYGVLIQPA